MTLKKLIELLAPFSPSLLMYEKNVAISVLADELYFPDDEAILVVDDVPAPDDRTVSNVKTVITSAVLSSLLPPHIENVILVPQEKLDEVRRKLRELLK